SRWLSLSAEVVLVPDIGPPAAAPPTATGPHTAAARSRAGTTAAAHLTSRAGMARRSLAGILLCNLLAALLGFRSLLVLRTLRRMCSLRAGALSGVGCAPGGRAWFGRGCVLG